MRHQTGATLISLLIGLLISMLCIMAVLASYRTVVKTGVESRIASTHDTQLQTGLTTAQIFLQNAGFGLEEKNNLLHEASIKVRGDTLPALLWRYKVDGTVVCQGLADMKTTDGKKRRFVLLESDPVACNELTTLNQFTWKIKATLARLEDYSADKSNPRQIIFERGLLNCSPFGSGNPDTTIAHPLITISAQTSTQKIASLGSLKSSVCLLNITS